MAYVPNEPRYPAPPMQSPPGMMPPMPRGTPQAGNPGLLPAMPGAPPTSPPIMPAPGSQTFGGVGLPMAPSPDPAAPPQPPATVLPPQPLPMGPTSVPPAPQEPGPVSAGGPMGSPEQSGGGLAEMLAQASKLR